MAQAASRKFSGFITKNITNFAMMASKGILSLTMNALKSVNDAKCPSSRNLPMCGSSLQESASFMLRLID